MGGGRPRPVSIWVNPVSDASRQKLKVSREGIVLIKSFEGFRPRALQRDGGGWVIGYGHTLSAREGASVSEADAELLLRYDLLAIEAAVNDAIPTDLNQHQFDALVSFAFSVGLDRFATSDVRQRLTAGATVAAADAMMGWPEPALPETALRRRVAERALFVADPSTPVALSDLLVAPLPSPSTQDEALSHETPVEAAAAVDARSAAVAALLGEPAERLIQPEASGAVATDSDVTGAIGVPSETIPTPSNDNPVEPNISETASEVLPPVIEAPEIQPSRYAPYAAAMVGPLPNLAPPAASVAPSPVPATEVAPVEPATVGEIAETPADQVAEKPAPPELILTPVEDAPEPALSRPLWSADERVFPDGQEPNLFGEDHSLTEGGGPIMRHEIDVKAPARFDWRETGPFIFMGGVGLVSFGAAMAAFRRAAEQAGGNELSIIGWVLALIGLACVGVSSINLYRRFGLPGGD